MSTAPDVRTYPAGVPCWIDTEQADPDAARSFYAELFGWTWDEVTPPGIPDSYWVAAIDGRDVAALAPSTEAPATWNTYIAVDDVDSAAARVAAQGGTVSGKPADVGPAGRAGRLAVCADPEGAGFRLWQAGARFGAQLVNAPGAWNFSHLRTRDLSGARAYYEAVFGWEHSSMPGGVEMWRVPGYGDHLAATSDPEIYARQAGAPEGFADVAAGVEVIDGGSDAPRWKVVFSVADRDRTAGAAEPLGAEVLARRDTMWTREADLRDPQGAELTISQFAPPAEY
jgi:uncharacterized protein